MQSLNVSGARDYCKWDNTLAASVHFEEDGDDFTSVPTVAFAGGGGSGAKATAVLSGGDKGSLVGINITDGGKDYTSAPDVTVSGGAEAVATVTGGVVTAVNITNPGGKGLTITDNTAYADDDELDTLQISLFDHFGGKVEVALKSTPALVGYGVINPVNGVDSIATVVSKLGKVKDGSVHDIGLCRTEGDYVMEL